MRIKPVCGAQIIDTASGKTNVTAKFLGAVAQQSRRAEAAIRRAEARSKIAVKLGLVRAVNRCLGYKVDRAGERIRSVLSTVRAAKHFDRLQIRRLIQIEKCVDTATLAPGRKTYAVHIVRDILTGQTANHDRADGRTCSLHV